MGFHTLFLHCCNEFRRNLRSPAWSIRLNVIHILLLGIYPFLPIKSNDVSSALSHTIYAVVIFSILYHIIVGDDRKKAKALLPVSLIVCVSITQEARYKDPLAIPIFAILSGLLFMVIMRDNDKESVSSLMSVSSFARIMISLIVFSLIQLGITGIIKHIVAPLIGVPLIESCRLGPSIPIPAYYAGLFSGAMGTFTLIAFSFSWYPHPTSSRRRAKIMRGVVTTIGLVVSVILLTAVLRSLDVLGDLKNLCGEDLFRLTLVTEAHTVFSVLVVVAATWLYKRENSVMEVICRMFPAALVAALITSFSRNICWYRDYESVIFLALAVELLPMFGLIFASCVSDRIQLCLLKPSGPH